MANMEKEGTNGYTKNKFIKGFQEYKIYFNQIKADAVCFSTIGVKLINYCHGASKNGGCE
jgi:hypothetical protein